MKFISVHDFLMLRRKMDDQPVSRCLFGPVDKEASRRFVQEQAEHMKSQMRDKYNFDFENETPLPGKYAWEEVGQEDEVPPAYHNLGGVVTASTSTSGAGTSSPQPSTSGLSQPAATHSHLDEQTDESGNERLKIKEPAQLDKKNTSEPSSPEESNNRSPPESPNQQSPNQQPKSPNQQNVKKGVKRKQTILQEYYPVKKTCSKQPDNKHSSPEESDESN